ncbi:MAG: Hint domain-containing protein [Pseudomonadota bacterium]
MPSYSYDIFAPDALVIDDLDGSVDGGEQFRVDPDWSTAQATRLDVTDDGTGMKFSGGDGATGTPNDADQLGTATEADGTVVSGAVFLDKAFQATAPDGSTTTFYLVHVDGFPVGYIADAPVQPGVTYEAGPVFDVGSGNAPAYADLQSVSHDPAAANTIEGGQYADDIQAGAGDDTVRGGDGNDVIDAGDGDDDVHGDAGDDSVDLGAGRDDYILADGFGNDTVDGGDDADEDDIEAGALSSAITVVATGDRAGTLTDGIGTVTFTRIDDINGTGFDDSIDLSASSQGMEIDGEGGHDSIVGTGGDDKIDGGAGDDTIHGGAGRDTVIATAGSDSVDLGTGADEYLLTDGFGNATVDGGNDADEDDLDATGLLSGVTVTATGDRAGTLTNGASTVTFSRIDDIDGSAHADSIDMSAGSQGMEIDAKGGDDTVIGSTGADSIAGDDGNDDIDGGDGADIVAGGTGDDTLRGGQGDDSLSGDAGNDSVLGNDGNDDLSGGHGADTLRGGAGDDTLRGGAGADRLFGDDGADTFIVEDGGLGDTLVGGEGGTDEDVIDLSGLFAPVSVNYTSNEEGEITDGTDTSRFFEIEKIVLTDGADYAVGGSTADTFIGGAGDDVLRGMGGDDSLVGGDGDDYLIGDGGADTLEGGAGDDTLTNWSGAAVLSGGDGSDTFLLYDAANGFGAGFDGAVVDGGEGGTDEDVLDLSDAAGPLTVTFTGDEAGEVTDGTETFTFTGIERIVLGDGADVVDASASSTGIHVVTGDGDDTVVGGAGNDDINGRQGDDVIDGGDGNDTLQGDRGDDSLSGGAGDDSIAGELDHDTLEGGDGNDTLNGGGGDDVLDGGIGDDSLLGASGRDQILGGDGADVVKGGSDADDISGGAGDDRLQGDSGDDTIRGDAGADTLSGGDGADDLDGGTGNDELDGELGDDVLDGGLGDDTIATGAGMDTVILGMGGGADVITDFDTGDDDGDGLFNDQLDVSALRTPDGDPIDAWDVVVSDDGFGNALLSFPAGESVVLSGVAPSQMASASQRHAAGVPCFTAGTLLDTPSGPRPVEDIRPGDLVQTLDDGAQPVTWRAARMVPEAALRRDPNLRPIRLETCPGGRDQPLLVSPQHGVLVRGVDGAEALVRAVHLARASDHGVRMADVTGPVFYVHLLLARHHVLVSNGIASESFYPGPWALSGLDPRDLMDLAVMYPHLGRLPPEDAYGPTARPFMSPKALRAENDIHIVSPTDPYPWTRTMTAS